MRQLTKTPLGQMNMQLTDNQKSSLDTKVSCIRTKECLSDSIDYQAVRSESVLIVSKLNN